MSLDTIRTKIDKAQRHAKERRELNAFALELFDRAIEEAAKIDPTAPLYGQLFSVKDLYQLDGTPLRAGTKASLPPIKMQAPVVTELLAAGALCVGKTNTHEIALGLTGENPWTGDVC